MYHGPVYCSEVLRSVYLGQVNPTLAWILLDSSHRSRDSVDVVELRRNASAVCLSGDCLVELSGPLLEIWSLTGRRLGSNALQLSQKKPHYFHLDSREVVDTARYRVRLR